VLDRRQLVVGGGVRSASPCLAGLLRTERHGATSCRRPRRRRRRRQRTPSPRRENITYAVRRHYNKNSFLTGETHRARDIPNNALAPKETTSTTTPPPPPHRRPLLRPLFLCDCVTLARIGGVVVTLRVVLVRSQK